MSTDLRIHIIDKIQSLGSAVIRPKATYEFETCRALFTEVMKGTGYKLSAPIVDRSKVTEEDKYGDALKITKCDWLAKVILDFKNDEGYGNHAIGHELMAKWKDHYAVIFWC